MCSTGWLCSKRNPARGSSRLECCRRIERGGNHPDTWGCDKQMPTSHLRMNSSVRSPTSNDPSPSFVTDLQEQLAISVDVVATVRIARHGDPGHVVPALNRDNSMPVRLHGRNELSCASAATTIDTTGPMTSDHDYRWLLSLMPHDEMGGSATMRQRGDFAAILIDQMQGTTDHLVCHGITPVNDTSTMIRPR